MREMPRFAAVAGLVLLGLSAPSRPSVGACCVAYDYNHAQTVVRDGVIRTISQRIDELERTLVAKLNDVIEALRQHSGQRLEESQREMRGLENLFATQDAREVERRISDARFEAARRSSPSGMACNIITGVGASTPAARIVAAARERRVDDIMDHLMGATPRTRSSESAMAGLIQRIEEICATHGTRDLVAAGVCASAAREEAVSPALSAHSLFAHAALPPAEARASALFGAAALGRPVGPVPLDIAGRADAVETLARMQTAAARQSGAALVLADMAARRQPIESPELRQWAQATAARLRGQLSAVDVANGVSALAVLELRAHQWFHDPEWLAQIDTNPEMAPRSTAQIAAFLAVLGYEQYRQMELMNLNLALLLSTVEEGLRR